MMFRTPILAFVGVACVAALPAAADPRPQTTPLAEPNLFISPSGHPYRSKAGEPYPVVVWFKETDTDHDGKIDRAEFKAEATAFFHMLDLRKNGVIDDEIISVYEKKLVPEIINANIQQPGQIVTSDSASSSDYKTKRQGAAMYGLLNNAEPLRSADHAFRGMVRLPDVLAQADLNFDELDYDHKGYLTLEDLPRPPAEENAVAAKIKK